MEVMFVRLVAACAILASAASTAAVDPAIHEVRTVYLLPMTNGLDQYLANRLTRDGRFQVITDPALADAIITDRIGQAFEEKMRELYPPPTPEPDESDEEDEKEGKEAGKKAADDASFSRLGGATHISSFSRGRGNVFLIDRKTKRVIWSYHKTPKRTTVSQMDRVAQQIVGQLQDDLKTKQRP